MINWIITRWQLFQLWLESFEPCPKEQMGYTCRHRILSNGKTECGYEQDL